MVDDPLAGPEVRHRVDVLTHLRDGTIDLARAAATAEPGRRSDHPTDAAAVGCPDVVRDPCGRSLGARA